MVKNHACLHFPPQFNAGAITSSNSDPFKNSSSSPFPLFFFSFWLLL